MSIPDAAIEAAATGLWNHRELDMVDGGYQCYCGERVFEGWAIAHSKVAYGNHLARAAVEAAMPAIREAIAQEVERHAAAIEGPRWVEAIRHAARIVRGGDQ